MFSEQEFQQAIDAVRDFSTKLRATVEILKSQAQTCVVNMEEDTVAQGASANLISVMDRIEQILDNDVRTLISNLEEEMERARRIAQYNEE